MEYRVDEGQSCWGCEESLCGVVLSEVFPWLSGPQLARSGAVCRAWRRAADRPALWRHLLTRDFPAASTDPGAEPAERWWCRQQYVVCAARWTPHSRVALALGGGVLHAALAPQQDALAICTDSAELAMWLRVADTWCELWREELVARGWTRVERAHWAGAGGCPSHEGTGRRPPNEGPGVHVPPRLLVVGERALVRDWELLVVQLDERYGYGCVLSRARCSPGGAGCWLDGGDAFLSLELQLLAPALACTTVWLNAATQETQSEHAGVTAPLLRVFNEGGAHVTHALVAPGPLLVAGSARGLAAWQLTPRLPPVRAEASDLAARAQRRRAIRAAPPPDPHEGPPPDEEAVRALCEPPAAQCPLDAPLIGLALYPSGWMCAVCADGSAVRVCARSLARVWVCAARTTSPMSRAPHYVQPSAIDELVASPAGSLSVRVRTWSAWCGAECAGVCAGRGTAVAALLTREAGGRPHLLVLTTHTLHEWCSRATPQCPSE